VSLWFVGAAAGIVYNAVDIGRCSQSACAKLDATVFIVIFFFSGVYVHVCVCVCVCVCVDYIGTTDDLGNATAAFATFATLCFCAVICVVVSPLPSSKEEE
jgi:hypothetical protein